MLEHALRAATRRTPVAIVASLLALLAWGGPGFADGPLDAAGCSISDSTLDLDGGTIHYSRSGQGSPVLLLHGLFAQKEQWHAVLCALAGQGYDAIAPDLPGFGQSTGFDVAAYDLGAQAERLRGFADGLKIGAFDLVGNSMGGTIAAIYAERFPKDVKHLAFIGPPLGVIAWGPRVRQAIEGGINPFIPVDRTQFDLEMGILFDTPPEVPAEIRDTLIESYTKYNRHYQQVWDIVNLFDTALDKRPLDRPLDARIPVLILWGEADAVYPVEGAATLQELLPGSRLVKLPRAGHLPMVERPAETASHLIAFLRDTP